MRKRTVLTTARLVAAGVLLGIAGFRSGIVVIPDRVVGDAAQVSIVDSATPQAHQLAAAAEAQVGVTVDYDASYVEIDYPGGDVPRSTGVCTDVVVRAFRELGIDLQVLVHQDMTTHFGAYPQRWGLSRPDPNIDHRRVPNLSTYFERQGAALPVSDAGGDHQPGDVVTWSVGGKPHIGIVSAKVAPGGDRFCIAHNIGGGTRVNDFLFDYPITGHYRTFD